MNHIKTISILLCLWPLVSSQSLWARELKPNEISILQSNIERNPENIRSRIFLGDHFFNKGDWDSVIRYLAPATESLTDKKLYRLALSYFELQKFKEATLIVETLMSRESVDWNVSLLKVKILAGMVGNRSQTKSLNKNKDKIYEILKEAQKLRPNSSKLYDTWVAIFDSATDYYISLPAQVVTEDVRQKFISTYSNETLQVLQARESNNVPLKPDHHSLMCKYNYLSGFPEKARERCQAALTKDPKNPSNYIYLGKTQIESGDEKKGQRMLASVGKKFSDSEEALWATANVYYEKGDLTKAYSFFRKATRHPQAQPRDFLGRARTAFELKKFSDALENFVQHCRRSGLLDHEFRRASGRLKNNPKLQERYRQKMLDCKP